MRAAALIISTGVLTIAGHSAAAAQTYSVTDVGSLSGLTLATAINASGQVTGASEAYDGSSVGLRWRAFVSDASGITDLGSLGYTCSAGDQTPRQSAGYGINGAGLVAGYAVSLDFTCYSHAVLFSAGKVTDLGTLPGGQQSTAYGINDAGLVTGHSDGAPGVIAHAVLWNGASITDLGTLGGTTSTGHAINNSGQVTGESDDATNTSHAFVTGPNGVGMTDLGTPGLNSNGLAINASGQVAGYVEVSVGAQHAALWNSSKLTDLGTLGGNTGAAQSINDGGVVTGFDYVSGAEHAFVWTANGGMKDLNSLISGNSALRPTLAQGVAINNNDWIVAVGADAHSYILKPQFMTFTPTQLSFPSQDTGTTSAAQMVTVTNTGTTMVALGMLSASGRFYQTNTCGATLDAGAQCSASVTFSPIQAGNQMGTLTVTADGAPYSVALSGAATTPVPPMGSGSSGGGAMDVMALLGLVSCWGLVRLASRKSPEHLIRR